MFAGNFLKDITGNNSINMLGNKLKVLFLFVISLKKNH